MRVTIKYFGMIAEHTGKLEEQLKIDPSTRLKDLKKNLQGKHHGLQQVHFSLAINHALITDMDITIPPDAEIALLPAFAGG